MVGILNTSDEGAVGVWIVNCGQCDISYDEPDYDTALAQAVEHENKTALLVGASFNHGVEITFVEDKEATLLKQRVYDAAQELFQALSIMTHPMASDEDVDEARYLIQQIRNRG